MILQVYKFIESERNSNGEARVLCDMLDGVTRTEQMETCTHVHFEDGTIRTYSPGELVDGGMFRLTRSYLLNNEGKTLRRAF